MKLKNIFLASVALVAMMLTSCSDKFEALMNSNIKVSSSYVAIPVGGGSTQISLETTGDYEIVGAPEWLTITPTSGAAGSTMVTFSADAYDAGRSTEAVMIKTANDSLRINVLQGLSTVSTATCAEVLAGIDNKTYRVTGTCTSIANTTYGNFYMNDGTGELYVYGTVDGSGAYNWSKFNIEIGDEVTVEGPKVTYSGTVELKDATFISVSKSLIKVDSVSVSNFTSDGGDTEVFLVNKGSGLYVDVPEDAQSWLSIKQVAGNKVVFHATANTASPRSTVLTFKTVSGGKDYTAQATISQDGLSGTLSVPFTVSEAIACCNKLSGTSASDLYVKGKVSKVVYDFSSKYGTATFWISDDGTYNDGDATKDFEAYSVYYFDNQKWADGNCPISVGDEVMICGKLTQYKGIAETSSKAAYVYSINGATSDANGVGSLAAPFNIAGAIASAKSGYTGNAYLEGTVSKVVYTFSAKYGTGTFWLSADGNYAGSADTDFEAYSVYYFGNQPWVDGNDQIAVGDKVTIYGKLTVYNGIAETSSKKAYVYSHNGKTE